LLLFDTLLSFLAEIVVEFTLVQTLAGFDRLPYPIDVENPGTVVLVVALGSNLAITCQLRFKRKRGEGVGVTHAFDSFASKMSLTIVSAPAVPCLLPEKGGKSGQNVFAKKGERERSCEDLHSPPESTICETSAFPLI